MTYGSESECAIHTLHHGASLRLTQTVLGSRAGITEEDTFIKLGFQRLLLVYVRWLCRSEARPRRRCGSKFNQLGHIGRSLVVRMRCIRIHNLQTIRDFIGSQCKHIRTGVIRFIGFVSVIIIIIIVAPLSIYWVKMSEEIKSACIKPAKQLLLMEAHSQTLA